MHFQPFVNSKRTFRRCLRAVSSKNDRATDFLQKLSSLLRSRESYPIVSRNTFKPIDAIELKRIHRGTFTRRIENHRDSEIPAIVFEYSENREFENEVLPRIQESYSVFFCNNFTLELIEFKRISSGSQLVELKITEGDLRSAASSRNRESLEK